MPRTTFASDNKATTTGRLDYPQLKLEYNERARVVVLEVNPVTEFVHILRMPVLIDGQPVMETKEFASGASREVIKRAFVGKHRCFGNFEILKGKGEGLDTENCVTCSAAKDGNGIEPPVQMFAVHVFQYNVKPGGFLPQEPMSGQLVAWVLNSRRWNELVDIAVDVGDIRAVDLMLGPCTNAGFQQFDVKPSQVSQSRWRMDDTAKRFVIEAYQNNKCPDLTPLFAQTVSKQQALDDIRTVERQNDIMTGRAQQVSPVGDTAAMTANVADMLNEVLEPQNGKPATSARTEDLDAELGQATTTTVVEEQVVVSKQAVWDPGVQPGEVAYPPLSPLTEAVKPEVDAAAAVQRQKLEQAAAAQLHQQQKLDQAIAESTVRAAAAQQSGGHAGSAPVTEMPQVTTAPATGGQSSDLESMASAPAKAAQPQTAADFDKLLEGLDM